MRGPRALRFALLEGEVPTRIAATRDQQCMFGLGTALRCPRPGAWQFDTRAMAPLGALPDAAILNLRVCDDHRTSFDVCPFTGTPLWQRLPGR